MEEQTMEVYTRGEVVDKIKRGQKAIQIEGPNIGSYMYISKDSTLCCDGSYVSFKFYGDYPNSKWIITN